MTSNQFSVTREIGIDMGHRVTFHDSKCRNLHGHRYKIEATCVGDLYSEGSQEGMVIDFSFLKREMMNVIDFYCDHGMVLWSRDNLAEMFTSVDIRDVEDIIEENGYFFTEGSVVGKLYIVPFVPTAENLAKHWFDRLSIALIGEQTKLSNVTVWETPNCKASYPA